MNFSKHLMTAATAALTFGTIAAVPVVSEVELTQNKSTREVTVTYALENAPCVVTLDIQTNTLADASGDWVSIGGSNFSNAAGDVFKRVESKGTGEKYAITWLPHLSWPDRKIATGGIRAVVTAWSDDDKPDVMVVGLSENVQDRVHYYPGLDYLPGGLLSNEIYRTTSIVMKRMHARNIPWVKGSQYELRRDADGREDAYEVTLTNDYYIGVFQLTQQQWYTIVGSYRGTYTGQRRMRPLETTSFARMRECDVDSNTSSSAYDWPHEPHEDSYLGRLYKRTGVRFDLPSDAEWEFAARGGHGERAWGDGAMMTYAGSNATDADAHLTKIVRCKANNDTAHTDDPTRGGTSEVGWYGAPNGYGLYDMGGNVAEFCQDFFTKDIAKFRARPHGEIIRRSEATYAEHVIHGCDPAGACYHRPARKNSRAANLDNVGNGFRLYCRDGLK